MRYQLLAFPLVLLMDAFLFVNFFNWHQQSIYEFEQRQMDLQVNYSVDAAAQQMLSDGIHIGTDYSTWGESTVEPSIALRTYQSVLLRNLGWADTEKNREDLIEGYVPFFIVAAYDGYYVYGRNREEVTTTTDAGKDTVNDAYPYHWSPKLPYSITANDKCYLYYLGYKAGSYVDISKSTPATMLSTFVEKVQLNEENANQYLRPSMARLVVSDKLSKACNSALFVGLEGDTDVSFYIPAEMSEWSKNNSVESPTILTYVRNNSGIVRYEKTTFGIGGSKIDDANFVVCYFANGVKRYGWAKDRDEILNHYSGNPTSFIKEILTSREAAASKGYYYDTEFYVKGV